MNGRLEIHLQGGYAPNVGDEFLIIANDGGDFSNNLFQGLQEGSTVGTVPAGNVEFTITRQGGDGNDVVLRVTKGGSTLTPDSSITKTHSPPTFTAGGDGTYTLTVTNKGTGSTAGTVTVTDTLPAGFTPAGATAPGWTGTAAAPIACTRQDVLAPNASYPAIDINVRLDANATTGTNTASVVGGGDTTSATINDPTTVVAAGNVDLTLAKSSERRNSPRVARAPTSSRSGISAVSPRATSSRSPTRSRQESRSVASRSTRVGVRGNQPLSCTRNDALQPNASSDIRIAVTVAGNAPGA